MEDISSDHAHKTLTVETHPHLLLQCASIHPCRHSSVMHSILKRLVEANHNPRPDQYLFWFLKFISAVLPTIEYDFTINVPR